MKNSGRSTWLVVYSVLVLMFLLAPVVLVILFSFNDADSASLPIRGLSTRWYTTFFHDAQLRTAWRNSLEVAAVTALICTVVGTLAAIAIVRYGGKLGALTAGLVILPLLVPPLLVGISLLSFFSHFHVTLSLDTVVFGHVVITLPLVALTVATRLAGIDPSLEEAGAVLGANRWQVFRHVTFPLLRVAVISSALLVAAVSLDEFLVTFFVAGTQQTLPLVIWGEMRTGVTPEINAVSTLLLVMTSLLVIFSRRLGALRTLRIRSRSGPRTSVLPEP